MRKLLFCLFFLCFPWIWLRAQQRIAFARLPPFERAVVCVKFFEGFHGKGCYPYVGYGHQLQKGELFSVHPTFGVMGQSCSAYSLS